MHTSDPTLIFDVASPSAHSCSHFQGVAQPLLCSVAVLPCVSPVPNHFNFLLISLSHVQGLITWWQGFPLILGLRWGLRGTYNWSLRHSQHCCVKASVPGRPVALWEGSGAWWEGGRLWDGSHTFSLSVSWLLLREKFCFTKMLPHPWEQLLLVRCSLSG